MKFDATSYAKNIIINMSSSAGIFASDYTMDQHLEFLDGFKLELGGIKQNGGSIDIDLKHDKISFKKVYIDVFGLHFLWSSKEEPWFIYHLCRTTNNEYYLSLLGRKKKNNIVIADVYYISLTKNTSNQIYEKKFYYLDNTFYDISGFYKNNLESFVDYKDQNLKMIGLIPDYYSSTYLDYNDDYSDYFLDILFSSNQKGYSKNLIKSFGIDFSSIKNEKDLILRKSKK